MPAPMQAQQSSRPLQNIASGRLACVACDKDPILNWMLVVSMRNSNAMKPPRIARQCAWQVFS